MLSPALKQFHEAVFVVTAPGFRDRQVHATHALGEGNFEFVFGLDASGTSIEELSTKGLYDDAVAKAFDPRGRSMPLGQICCAISHREVYRRMVRDNISKALIFEDDVTVLQIDDAEIEIILANVPTDAELVNWSWVGFESRPAYYFAVQWYKKIERFFGKGIFTYKMLDNFYPREVNDHFLIAGKHYWANAYTITLEAARSLLELNTPVILNADLAMLVAALNEDIRVYLSKRKLFSQGSADPDHIIDSYTG